MKKYFFTFIILLGIMQGCKDDLEPPTTGQIITMIVSEPRVGSWTVELELFGTGEAIVYWGDGTNEKITMSNGIAHRAEPGSYWINVFNYCQHHYLGDYPGSSTYSPTRKITITGNVTYLNCGGNRVTSLDASKNPALETLCCYGIGSNGLTSLNISKNFELAWLDVSENLLTTLYLSNNTKLNVLNCEDNLLTNLDVSNNPALEWLSCARNQLLSLNVGNNPKLEELYCFRNELTSLNVKNSHRLKELYAYNNQLTSDAMNALFESLHSNKIEEGKEYVYQIGNTPIGISLISGSDTKSIYVNGNPGANGCDPSIATNKGWRVSAY